MRKTLKYKLIIRIGWRYFWRQRNKYNNDIKTAEKKYYYNRLTIQNNKIKKDIKCKDHVTNDNTILSTIKDMTNSYNKTPPRYIDYDNRPVTLLRQIHDIANSHYIDKIDKIRQN